MANPEQQGLKRNEIHATRWADIRAEMANPEQQGLKPAMQGFLIFGLGTAEMANPEQQGLKLARVATMPSATFWPKWLIQNNKD